MPRVSLSQTVADGILDAILGGELTPNDSLPTEPLLEAKYDVSRTAVREAISALRAQGVIRVERGRGTFVNDMSEWVTVEAAIRAASRTMSRATASAKLIDARRLVEVGSIELTALHRTDEDLVALDALLAEMRDAHERGDVESFVRADIGMHRRWLMSTGNPFIPMLFEPLNRVLWEGRTETSEVPEIREHAIEHHGAIQDAVAAGDSAAAVAAMSAHIDQTYGDLHHFVVQNPPD